MATKLVQDSSLTSIANAIRTKGGTSASLEFPTGFVTAINNISGGGGSAPPKDINFIDYDGTIVESYTVSEWSNVSALPGNPSHTGLIAQGWNWTKAQIDSQISNVGAPVWVGQMYVTSSGDTEIDVEMQDGRLSPTLTIGVNGRVIVNWGDNTTADIVIGSSTTTNLAVSHTYASAGNYTITIKTVSGSFNFPCSATNSILSKNATASQNRVYANCVKAIRLGSSIMSINRYTFYNCNALISVTIPSDVSFIGESAFSSCFSLTSITIPSDVTNIDSNTFSGCYSLTSITIPSGVTSIGLSAFYSCYSLTSVTIPSGVWNINNYAFYNCFSLTSITISNDVTKIKNYTFYGCYSLTSITIPSGVTSIGDSAFYDCCSLARVTISSNVTSIGSSAFNGCVSLASIMIPSNVTSIGSNAFSGCYGVAEYHIKPTTVPTASTTIFNYISSDCVIYVPSASLTDYQTASNWSTYASYMQQEPA